MKYLLTGVAAIALLTGCGGKEDKPDTTEAATGEIERQVEKVMDVKARKGDPATAGQALAAFSLDGEDTGRVSFADSDLKGDKATFTDVVIAGETEDDSPIKAGKLVFDGLGMTDGQANFSRMTLSNVVMTPGDQDVKVDGNDAEVDATIAKIELVNPSAETAAWVASLMGKGEPAVMPTGKALQFDQWSMDDLSFNINEEGGDQGSFIIENVAITGMKDERADQMVLSDMRLDMDNTADDEQVKFSINEIKVRGVDMKFIEAFANTTGDEDEMAAAMMKIANADPIDPGYDSISMDDMSMDVEGVAFAIPSFNANVKRNKAGQPIQMKTDEFKMTLAADSAGGELGEQLAGGLAMIGYDKIELKGKGLSNYDPDTDTISYKAADNVLTLDDGFKLNFGGKIEGYSAFSKASNEANLRALENGDEPNPEAMMGAMEDLIIHNFSLKFEDNSIIDRAFNAAAAEAGEDPQQMKNQLVGLMAMAPLMAGGSGADMALISDTTSALSKLITDGGAIEIELAPKQPLKVGELAEMEDPSLLTKDFLGYSATHSK